MEQNHPLSSQQTRPIQHRATSLRMAESYTTSGLGKISSQKRLSHSRLRRLIFRPILTKKISLHRLYRLIGSTYHNPKRLETPLDIFLRRFTRKRSGSLRQRLRTWRGNGTRRSNGNGTTRIHLQGNTYVLLHKRVAHEYFKLEVFPN